MSNFDAICNHEDSKLTINKSKIRNALKAIIGIILKTANSDIDQKFTVGEKVVYGFNTTLIYTCSDFLSPIFFICNVYLTFNILAEIVNSKSKVFDKGDNKAHTYIIPSNTGTHWVVLFLLGLEKKSYYFDCFGNPPNDRLLNLVNKTFLFWLTQHNCIKLQNAS